MPLQIQPRRKKLVLTGELNIYSVREAAGTLLPRVRQHREALDLGGISEIDSAGLQLLLAAQRVAQAAGHELQIAAASQAVREVFDLVHCDELRQCLRSAA